MIQGKYIYSADKNEIKGVVLAQNRTVATGRLYWENQIYYIDDVTVCKEEQGKGYGDFIVKMLVDKAFREGTGEVIIYSPYMVAAFFEKIGFTSVKNEKEDEKQKEAKVKLRLRQEDLLRKCQK